MMATKRIPTKKRAGKEEGTRINDSPGDKEKKLISFGDDHHIAHLAFPRFFIPLFSICNFC